MEVEEGCEGDKRETGMVNLMRGWRFGGEMENQRSREFEGQKDERLERGS